MPENWYWNEFALTGTDYGSIDEVARYDRRMAQVRDVAAENRAILAALDLPPEADVIEIGCGTGAFSVTAAAQCRKVFAVDISRMMLSYVETRAKREGVANIELCNGGFLTYEHKGAPVDAVVSGLALHHLPDFWKSVALRRVAAMLKPGGRFFLMDVVYSFDTTPEEFFPAFVNGMPEDMRPHTTDHVGREYSTWDWIMRGLLERAGFTIEDAKFENGWIARYLCRKAN